MNSSLRTATYRLEVVLRRYDFLEEWRCLRWTLRGWPAQGSISRVLHAFGRYQWARFQWRKARWEE